MRRTSIGLVMVALFALSIQGVHAATLSDYFGSAYSSGITPFANGQLNGTIQWAVFAPGNFPAVFTGYSPLNNDEMTYTYQLFAAGAAAVSSLEVYIDPGQPVDSFGSFSGGGLSGVSPLGSSGFTGSPIEVADWNFNQFTGTSTIGLAFSSPNIPMDYAGKVLDGGTFTEPHPLPSPSGIPIPEPSTAVLAFIGMAFCGIGAFGCAHSSKR